jgi:hypothetical protein
MKTGEISKAIETHESIDHLALLPNGNIVLSKYLRDHNVEIRIWDLKTGSMVNTFSSQLQGIINITPLSNSNLAICNGKNVKIVNSQNGQSAFSFPISDFPIYSDFDSDFLELPNEQLAICSGWSYIYIYNFNTGKQLKKLESFSNRICRCRRCCLLLLYESKMASSCSNDSSYSDSESFIRIWDFNSGQVISNLSFDGCEMIKSLALLRNGILASVSFLIFYDSEEMFFKIRLLQWQKAHLLKTLEFCLYDYRLDPIRFIALKKSDYLL